MFCCSIDCKVSMTSMGFFPFCSFEIWIRLRDVVRHIVRSQSNRSTVFIWLDMMKKSQEVDDYCPLAVVDVVFVSFWPRLLLGWPALLLSSIVSSQQQVNTWILFESLQSHLIVPSLKTVCINFFQQCFYRLCRNWSNRRRLKKNVIFPNVLLFCFLMRTLD